MVLIKQYDERRSRVLLIGKEDRRSRRHADGGAAPRSGDRPSRGLLKEVWSGRKIKIAQTGVLEMKLPPRAAGLFVQ